MSLNPLHPKIPIVSLLGDGALPLDYRGQLVGNVPSLKRSTASKALYSPCLLLSTSLGGWDWVKALQLRKLRLWKVTQCLLARKH